MAGNDTQILSNGRILSYDIRGNRREYEALAIRGEKILMAGSNEEAVQAAGKGARVLDLQGKTVLAGMTDAHLHVSMAVEMIASVDLYLIDPEEGESREDYLKRQLAPISEYAAEHPEAKVIRGTGWNPATFKAVYGSFPTAEELDLACSDRPVLLRSYCHHFLWLNSRAIEMTGIDKDHPLDPVCEWDKNEQGEPRGVFIDIPATEAVLDSFELADYSVEEYKAGILYFQERYAFPNGIVNVFDAMLRPHARQAYQELAEEGKLKMRVRSVFMALPDRPDSQFDEMIRQKGAFDVGEAFRIDTVKFFFDGGEISSLMLEPLEKDFLEANGYPADYRGKYIWESERARRIFPKLAEAGFQIHIHVMGDGAAREAIDLFQELAERGIPEHRHTMTHIQCIKEEDMERMAKYGIIAAMQGHWGLRSKFSDMLGVPVFGQDRTDASYPMGGLWKKGVLCSAASIRRWRRDCPLRNLSDYLPFRGRLRESGFLL